MQEYTERELRIILDLFNEKVINEKKELYYKLRNDLFEKQKEVRL